MDASSYYLGLPPLTTRAKRLHALNAKQSPFLRLPPEIRSRIYREVLGGHTIHIQSRPWKNSYAVTALRFSACQRKISERHFVRTAAASAKPTERIATDIESFFCRHRACMVRKQPYHAFLKNVILFQMLFTCRQIYNEAAMIPFEANDFLFEELQHIPWFLKQVNERQSQAVRNIIIVPQYLASVPVGVWTSIICWLKFLPLKNLIIVFELMSIMLYASVSTIADSEEVMINQMSLLDHNARAPAVYTYMVRQSDQQPYFTIKNLDHIQKFALQLTGQNPRTRPALQLSSLPESWKWQHKLVVNDPDTSIMHRKRYSITFRQPPAQPGDELS